MPLADRFTEYVAELHELSGSHRLPHGAPEDFSRALEAFQSSQTFAADFGCVMRSIALREHFRASETELLTLVAVAWAGAEPNDSTPEFAHHLQELRGILHKALAHRVLSHRTDGPAAGSNEDREKLPAVSSGLPGTTRTLEELGPNGQMSGELPSIQESHEKRSSAAEDSASLPRITPAQEGKPISSGGASQGPEHAISSQTAPLHDVPKESPTAREDKSKSLDFLHTYSSGAVSESVPRLDPGSHRLEPSAAEILATGLTGLVVALLFSAGSLPIYRARVSVYLPSAIAGATDPRQASLLNGELTERVAEHLLALPQVKPILRQDVVSRGMRDLSLGGNETILYADLVADTARQVKVTHLQPQNLYAITCDSWSAQFAATFCNELTGSLNDPPSSAISAAEVPPARTIDAASGPGSQVYPRWYLLGSAGLAVGCLVGLLLGFVKRPVSKPLQKDDLET